MQLSVIPKTPPFLRGGVLSLSSLHILSSAGRMDKIIDIIYITSLSILFKFIVSDLAANDEILFLRYYFKPALKTSKATPLNREMEENETRKNNW